MAHDLQIASTETAVDRQQDTRKRMSRRGFLLAGGLGAISLLGMGALFKVPRWRYIVIHHSAGQFGNVAFLDKVHRQRQPYDPIDSMAYHLVIGNGHGLPLGKVEHGLRWQKGLWGAHVSARNHRYNFGGIGVCLIGNYHEQVPPGIQYQALVRLVRGLQKTHNIPSASVFTHGHLKGERTVCPGRHFPYGKFYGDIGR